MMRHSRSVFEPQTRVLCSTFEDAGVPGALKRLQSEMEARVGTLHIPAWVWSLDFAQAAATAGGAQLTADAQRWVQTFGRIAKRFGNQHPNPTPSEAQCPEQRVAVARLAYGAMLEAFASSRAEELLPPDEVAGASVDQQRLALLYSDAYCAAVWTSAHAEYLALVNDLLAEAPRQSVRDLMVPPPELYSVLNLSNLLHLGPLYERIATPRCCAKASQSLLAILSRVTNSGSRGWESTLLAALKDSEGAVRVCMHAVGVALSGLNPVVHPAARAPWHRRFVLLRALRAQQSHGDFRELVAKAPLAIKEAIRLHLTGVMSVEYATLAALRHARQPAGQLLVPPHGLPHPSLAAAMHAMVAAGEDMASKRVSAAVAIKRNLVSQPRSRKKSHARASKSGSQPHARLAHVSSWIGGRSGGAGATLRPATQVVSGLFAASYRATYIPFWLHGNHKGHRASRLDSAQHAALHSRSPVHTLCSLLSSADYAKAQHLAFSVPSSDLLTVAQAFRLLGIAPASAGAPGLACPGSSRAAQEAEIDVMSLAARDAALLFAFTRLALLRASILAYDLGAATRRKQALAVCQRLMLTLAPGEDPVEAAQTRLPPHACSLFFCSECKRVANSVQDGSGKETPFNEEGPSASNRVAKLARPGRAHPSPAPAPSPSPAPSLPLRTAPRRSWVSPPACSSSTARCARVTCAARSAHRRRYAPPRLSRPPQACCRSSSSIPSRIRCCRATCALRPLSPPCAARGVCRTRRPPWWRTTRPQRWQSSGETSSRVTSRAARPQAAATYLSCGYPSWGASCASSETSTPPVPCAALSRA
tara:strand:+ start:6485 stop:8938 length:2454 start_codon:yes stop_codon:yes gene_type:complete